jgi:hypothetical protein
MGDKEKIFLLPAASFIYAHSVSNWLLLSNLNKISSYTRSFARIVGLKAALRIRSGKWL